MRISVQGPARWRGRTLVSDAEDLQALPLWPTASMACQHWRVHTLPRRVWKFFHHIVQCGYPFKLKDIGRIQASFLTEVVPGWQVLVLAAGVSLLPVQQEVIDHLFLVLPVDDSGTEKKETFKSILSKNGKCFLACIINESALVRSFMESRDCTILFDNGSII